MLKMLLSIKSNYFCEKKKYYIYQCQTYCLHQRYNRNGRHRQQALHRHVWRTGAHTYYKLRNKGRRLHRPIPLHERRHHQRPYGRGQNHNFKEVCCKTIRPTILRWRTSAILKTSVRLQVFGRKNNTVAFSSCKQTFIMTSPFHAQWQRNGDVYYCYP